MPTERRVTHTNPPRPPVLQTPTDSATGGHTGEATPNPPEKPTPTPAAPLGAYLTGEQVATLMKPLSLSRVSKVQGNSHLEAWDVRAHLTRIFGFLRWTDEATQPTALLFETEGTKDGNPRWTVAYMSHRRLTIYSPGGVPLAFFDGSAVGDAINQPSRGDAHDLAVKSAESQALKRCASNLGTQFGLSLYDDGRTSDVIRRVLIGGDDRQPLPLG